MNPDPLTTIPLGQTDVQISPLGIGVWSWGDRWYWGYGRTFGEEDVRGAFQESIAAGVTLFDT
ncbi:MAG: aldo/keto reductase, partial [Chloroflexi bacterium]|nr:aldo/keto reductase [Chloroflexota bacterium]